MGPTFLDGRAPLRMPPRRSSRRCFYGRVCLHPVWRPTSVQNTSPLGGVVDSGPPTDTTLQPPCREQPLQDTLGRTSSGPAGGTEVAVLFGKPSPLSGA